ncbi:MAG: protein-L-isoaspartate O-methyltransferase, partial [Gammaproteobacteria bacterium]|nr:protein-L-isoaspartate O-methyltransferase [Gammaproteobacteria bacterium]
NMIEQQIRPWEVLDPRVLNLLADIRREDFVPSTHCHLAFADIQIPLIDGEVMMQPKVEARLLQALAPEDDDNVLEIGTGSGYMTALLAALSKHVVSVEINPELKQMAAQHLENAAVFNTTLEVGDAARGWDNGAPYDAIILTGSVPTTPESFKHIIAPGGRLVAVVGQAPIMEAMLYERLDDKAWRTTSLFDTSLPALKNVEMPPEFIF